MIEDVNAVISVLTRIADELEKGNRIRVIVEKFHIACATSDQLDSNRDDLNLCATIANVSFRAIDELEELVKP